MMDIVVSANVTGIALPEPQSERIPHVTLCALDICMSNFPERRVIS
jgi:hypothetical protein